MQRLDEEKIDLLRQWGEGLERDTREELRAAGRAILLLIEEIEQLHVDLWNQRPEGERPPAPAQPEIESSLLARLAHLGRRRGEDVPEAP